MKHLEENIGRKGIQEKVDRVLDVIKIQKLCLPLPLLLFQDWGLNVGPLTSQASALTLSYIPVLFLRQGLTKLFHQALNLCIPYLSLLSSRNHRLGPLILPKTLLFRSIKPKAIKYCQYFLTKDLCLKYVKNTYT